MTFAILLHLYGSVAALLLPVAVCAGVGAYWGFNKRVYPGNFVSVLATTVATPALVFHTLLTTRLDDAQLLQVFGAGVLGLAVVVALAAVCQRLAGLPAAALLPSATFPNTGNLGLPVAQLVYGETGLTVATAFFAICSFMQHSLGIWWLRRHGLGEDTPRGRWPRGVALACLLVVLLRALGIQVAAPPLISAQLVGSLAVQLMLLSLGYALATVSHTGVRRGALLGLIRLGVGPVAGLVVASTMGLPPLVASVLQLQFLMPVAVTNYLYAERFTPYGHLSAGAVLVSISVFLQLSPLLLRWTGADLQRLTL